MDVKFILKGEEESKTFCCRTVNVGKKKKEKKEKKSVCKGNRASQTSDMGMKTVSVLAHSFLLP